MDMDVTARFRADISDMKSKMGQLNGLYQDSAGKWRSASGQYASNSQKAAAGIDTLTASAKRSSKGFTVLRGAIASGLGFSTAGLITSAVTGMKNFAGEVVNGARQAVIADQRLDAIAESMGYLTSVGAPATERLKDFADSLEMQTGVTAETVKQSQSLILTFKNVADTASEVGGMFDRATEATLDLAAAGFGSAESNAKSLGKALNDPIKGITALSRQGVTFTNAEKEKIKTLVESGKMLEAQELIMSAVEMQVGGTAAATATAGSKMKAAMGMVTDELGMALLPIIDKVAASFTTFLTEKALPAMQQFLGYLQANVFPVAQTVFGYLQNALMTVFRGFQSLYQAIIPLAPLFLPIIAGILGMVAAFKLLTAGQTAIKSMGVALDTLKAKQIAFNAAVLANPYVLVGAIIVGALAAIAAAFKMVYDRSEVLRKAVSDVIDVFKAVASTVISEVMAAFTGLFGTQKKVGGSMEGFGDILQKVADVAGPILAGALQYVSTYLKVVGNVLRVGIKGFEIFATIVKMVANVARVVFVAAFQKATSVLSTLMDKLGPIGAAVKRVASAIGSAFSNIPALISGAIRSAVGFVEGLINKAIGAINFLIDAYNKIPFVDGVERIAEFSFGAFESGAAAVNNLSSTMGGLESQMIAAGGVVNNVVKKQKGLNETLEETSGASDKAGKAEDKRAEKIKKQTEVLQKSLSAAKAAYGAIKSLTESRFGEDSQILKAFGTEGDISSTIGMYDQLDAALNDYYTQLLKAPGLSKKVTASLEADRDAQRTALKDAAQSQVNLFRQRAKIQSDLNDLETSYARTTSGIGERFDALDKQADDAVKSIEARYAAMIPGLEKALSTATAAYEKENAVLQGLIGQRDSFLSGIQSGFRGFLNSLTFPLKKAQQAVKDVLPAATMQRTIKEYANGLRVTIESEIKPAMEELSESIGEQALTAGDIRGALEERLAQIRSFASNIQTLMARGLDSTLIQEFVSAGVSGAGEAASALISASGEEISAINDIQSALAAEVASFGTFGAEQWYAAGIAQQEAIVAPLAIAASQAQMALDLANASRDSELNSARAHAEQLKLDRQAALNVAHEDYKRQKDLLDTQMKETNAKIEEGATALQDKFTALQQTLPPQMHRIGEASANMILKGFKDRYPNLSEKLNNMMTRLANEMRRETTITVTTVHKSVFEGTRLPAMALGGPVQARQAYIVGEKGPELFMSNQAGNIIPNNALRSPMPAMRGVGNGGGGNVTNVSINVQAGLATDPAETGRQVVEAIRKYERRSGPVFVSA